MFGNAYFGQIYFGQATEFPSGSSYFVTLTDSFTTTGVIIKTPTIVSNDSFSASDILSRISSRLRTLTDSQAFGDSVETLFVTLFPLGEILAIMDRFSMKLNGLPYRWRVVNKIASMVWTKIAKTTVHSS